MWVVAAVAAPSFVGPEEDVAVATRAWALAVACTGHEPATATPVVLTRGAPPDAFGGVAHQGPAGLEAVVLDPTAPPAVLVHELAHAWTPAGPPALVEGRTGLLTVCVLRTLAPSVAEVLVDQARRTPRVDLFHWENPATADPVVVRRAYRAALQLFLGLDDWLPQAALWSPATTSWEGLARVVLTAPEAERWRALGAFGRDHPWADVDEDGVANDVERAFGRDPGHADGASLGPRVVTALHWPAGSAADVDALRSALSAAHGRAAGLLGPLVEPLRVRVASGPTFADDGLDPASHRSSGNVVAVPTSTDQALGPAVTLGDDLGARVRARDWDALATTAVALHLAWSSSVRDLGAAEALARDLSVRSMPATGLAPFDDLDWQGAARACPAGWRGVLDHTCPPPTPAPPEPAGELLPR